MPSSSGTSTSTGSEQDPKPLAVNNRKQKRMLSNRESARRSRQRKQSHLDDLAGQVGQIKKENSQIVTSLNITTQHYLNMEAENSILRAQMGELSQRLQSLNDIINFMNPTTVGFVNQVVTPEVDHSFIDSWSSAYLTQPIVASNTNMMFDY